MIGTWLFDGGYADKPAIIKFCIAADSQILASSGPLDGLLVFAADRKTAWRRHWCLNIGLNIGLNIRVGFQN